MWRKTLVGLCFMLVCYLLKTENQSTVMKRQEVEFIVVHCTGTPINTRVKSIQDYWKYEKNWDNPGYNYLVDRYGTVHKLLDESKIANGVIGHNEKCIHLGYIGGIDAQGRTIDNRTEAQKEAMFYKLVELSEKYPKAKIVGHNEFEGVKKLCPCIDLHKWLREYIPPIDTAA